MTCHCPGQDGRNLRVETLKCPSCGAEVEIFSDESSVRCRKCGARVCRGEVSSCYQWCAAVRECLGEEKWQALKGNKNA